jgi:carbon-monoxide dehydrogenase small subunit
VEALSPGGVLHPLQEAFRDHHALQCGLCTPGMLLTAVDLLARNPAPSAGEVREELSGNLCRCTGYQRIVSAVLDAAARLRGGRPAAGAAAGWADHPPQP